MGSEVVPSFEEWPYASKGNVISITGSRVEVKWRNGNVSTYKRGQDGEYDIKSICDIITGTSLLYPICPLNIC